MPSRRRFARPTRRAQPHALLALLLAAASAPAPARAEAGGTGAARVKTPRIERVQKLRVPSETSSDVWSFLEQRYLESSDALRAIDPLLTSHREDLSLTDVYFDTPALDLLAQRSGVRHRTRVNSTDQGDRPGARERMQIERNAVSSSGLERRELSFKVRALRTPTADGREAISTWSRDDNHPMLGIVKRSRRDEFKQRLAELGVDPEAMQPILSVRDLRRRIRVLRDGVPFLSISMDVASSSLWWAQTRSVEIELEPDVSASTDAAARLSMEGALASIVGEIRAQFPELQSDPTPMYNQSFAGLEHQLPFLRMLVRANAHGPDRLPLLAIIGIGVLTAALLVPLRFLRQRARARQAAAS